MIIGAHVSTSGGLKKAVGRAKDLGCNGMQIFTGSPRVWKSKSVDEYDTSELAEAMEQAGVLYVVIHATYLVNLASDKPELLEKSRKALINDLAIAAKGKMAGVVVHLGSHQGRGYEAMRKQLVKEIRKVLDQSPREGKFLIENSAGQKGKIGSDLAEVKDLLEAVDSPRLGWCVDTCHGHAAGYLLGRNQESKIISQNDKQKIKNEQESLFDEKVGAGSKLLEDEIERLGLWEKMWCVHVNGSRDLFGSGRDRHANLGEGEIADADMIEFLNHKQIKSKPLVLEVPGFDGKGPDKKNVEILKSWIINE